MAGILSFDQFLGGPDQIKVEQVFPSNQRTLIYNFNQDITDWVFTADHQTLIVDQIAFNRNTGAPNFTNRKVIGSFPKVELSSPLAPTVMDALIGTVKVILPAGMYSGPIVPDARQNVPITVFSLTWSDAGVPAQVQSHRWSLIQCYEPDVTVGDPTSDANFTPLVIA